MHRNKRGQFFLIAALITIMVLFTLTVKYNTIKQTVALEDFKELSEGYSTEQPKVINLAIAEGKTATEQGLSILSFTKNYQEFAQGKEPSFGILYAYRDPLGNIHVVNSLTNKVINIEFQDPETGKTASLQLLSSDILASGNICNEISGGQRLCTTLDTNVASYGQKLSEGDLGKLQKLNLKVKYPGSSIPTTIPIEFTTTTFSSFVTGDECQGDCLLDLDQTIKATLTEV